jgi:hypothetical protein
MPRPRNKTGTGADAIRAKYRSLFARLRLRAWPEEFSKDLPAEDERKEFARQFPEDYRLIMRGLRERGRKAATLSTAEISKIQNIETRKK